jgi:hypothetical protein
MTPRLDARAAAVLADQAEAAAYNELWRAAPVAVRSALGVELRELSGATQLLAPGLPVAMFNRVIGLGLNRPATGEDLDTLLHSYRAAGCRDWWLHWNPHAEPAQFGDVLLGRGFTLPARGAWAKMLWQAPALPQAATRLQVALARDDQINAVTESITQAFGMPPLMAGWLAALQGRERWRVYAACDGERVVGGGCLYLDGDTAWLGMGSVVESHRQLGGQRALMALRIRDALDAGCRHIATETGEPVAGEPNPSLLNMQRSGFVSVASRLNYAAPLPGRAG